MTYYDWSILSIPSTSVQLIPWLTGGFNPCCAEKYSGAKGENLPYFTLILFLHGSCILSRKQEKLWERIFRDWVPPRRWLLRCLHISYVICYTTYLVWIGFTLEYFLVWSKFKLLVMISVMTVTVVMPMDRWRIMTGAYYQFPQPQYNWSRGRQGDFIPAGRRKTPGLRDLSTPNS